VSRKLCPFCEVERDLACFRRKTSGTYYSYCADCEKIYRQWYYQDNKKKISQNVKEYRSKNQSKVKQWTKTYNENNRAKRKDTRLKYLYGISAAEYRRMWVKQKGLCAICEQYKKLVIDHCHESGRIRELLCKTCNAGIGFFRENTTALDRASAYLKHHTIKE
jgi:hypothetical protein